MFIPPDIIYTILDNLSSDPTSLKRCSLVSHTFLTHSHKLLFSHIHLAHPRPCRGLYRAISANAALAGHIRTIEVTSNVRAEFRGRDWVTIEHTLAPLLQTLHSLQSFVFRGTFLPALPWAALPTDLRQAVLEISAPSVTLQSIANPPMGPFGRMQGLRRLCLVGVASDAEHVLDLTSLGAAAAAERFPQRLGYLEYLEIRGSYTCGRHLVRTLTDLRSRLRLSRLKELVLDGNGGFADKIMDVAGAILERLVWHGLGEANEGPFTTFPSSLPNTLPALHTLSISTKFARGHTHDPLPLLVRSLSPSHSYPGPSPHAAATTTTTTTTTTASSALTHLTLTLDFYGVWKFAITQRDADAVNTYPVWALLDAALSARPAYASAHAYGYPGTHTYHDTYAYAGLERVTVVLRVGGGGGGGAFAGLERRGLGALERRGVVRMVYEG